MKQNLIILILCCSCLSALLMSQAADSAYHLKVKIDNYENDTLLMAYRLGSKTYIKDTVVGTDPNGYFHFRGDTILKGGIYLMVVRPSNDYFEFLVSSDEDQQFTMQTKIVDKNLSDQLRIEGSADNQTFQQYLKFLKEMGEKTQPWQSRMKEISEALKEETTDASKRSTLQQEQQNLQEKMDGVNKEVVQYQNKLIAQHPNYLSAGLILSTRQPEIPETITDRAEQFYYYRNHFWDNFSWGDSRMIRTPVFEQKIETYLENLTVKEPDSQIVACDYLLQNIIQGGDKDMYQYVASHLLNKFAKTKLICMDKVYAHIGGTYYCGAEKPDWIDEEQLAKICKNVEDLSLTLCGMRAPDINLTNIATGKPVNLYDLKARFTLVYFWDPGCNTCTKTSKKLVPVYNKWKDKGLVVYGISSESMDNIGPAKKKIAELEMNWINTSGKPYELAVVKKTYNVKSNPQIYMLDEDKKILYKRLDPEQIDDILGRELGETE